MSLLGFRLSPRNLSRKKSTGNINIGRVSRVVGEVFGDGTSGEFGAKEVHLVEEQDQGGSGEPLRVGNGLEQHQCLLHLIL